MRQTTLDLNGPILGVVTQPVGITTPPSSTVTFVGIATATFPTQTPSNPATGTGNISYQWYADGIGALSDGSLRGATISGTATTTLTVSNVKSPDTNNLRFYLSADYVPSAYQSSPPVTAGTARSTGNAINEPLIFNTVSLTVLPTITITSQPQPFTTGSGRRVSFSVSATISDSSFGGLSYQWEVDGQNLTNNGSTVIGANQPTLFYTPTSVGVFNVRVIVSNSSAGAVSSATVTLVTLPPRDILIFEGFDSQNNYIRQEVNLGIVNNFTLSDITFGSNFNIISFYAPENSIDGDLEIRASKGLDVGSFSGGQGGFSRIRMTIEKDVEYVVLGISDNSGLFIYRKATLIAVVGKGGSAGSSGRGGAGGGINLPGEDGSGRNSGSGGARVFAGQLTTNGIFGSNSSTPLQSGDSRASIPNGGRTISCPKGSYWLSQGKSPCENLGLIQFYNTNGSLIPQSSLIDRGFKPGYSITVTEGASISNGGDGGNGATGGAGGDQGGGGGGSGYANGPLTVTTATSGGTTASKSTINFRIFVPLPPISGCTNPAATNYNPNAQVDDGSCRFAPPPQIRGCTDPSAQNYNPRAQIDDGSCIYLRGCTNPSANNYNPRAQRDDGSCTFTPQPPKPQEQPYQSFYGTGLVGTTKMNDGTPHSTLSGVGGYVEKFGGNGGVSATAVSHPSMRTSPTAPPMSNEDLATFVRGVYQSTLSRPPDGPGFDFWMNGARAGQYTDPAHLQEAIRRAGIANNEAPQTQSKGGVNGTFAVLTDGSQGRLLR